MSVCKRLKVFGFSSPTCSQILQLLDDYAADIQSHTFKLEPGYLPENQQSVHIEFHSAGQLLNFFVKNSDNFFIQLLPSPNQLIPVQQHTLFCTNCPLISLQQLKSHFLPLKINAFQFIFDKETLAFKNGCVFYFANFEEADFCTEKYYNSFLSGFQIKLHPGKFVFNFKPDIESFTFRFEKMQDLGVVTQYNQFLVKALIQYQKPVRISQKMNNLVNISCANKNELETFLEKRQIKVEKVNGFDDTAFCGLIRLGIIV
ncbi:RNA-binding_domain superfamily [Hexamita inflata]|uniref:RNA-binding_domain superfamily n=1 Tax=Hexamita inflata TaxID=28002 RepID=A0ABP1HEB9_9EUKA